MTTNSNLLARIARDPPLMALLFLAAIIGCVLAAALFRWEIGQVFSGFTVAGGGSRATASDFVRSLLVSLGLAVLSLPVATSVAVAAKRLSETDDTVWLFLVGLFGLSTTVVFLAVGLSFLNTMTTLSALSAQ